MLIFFFSFFTILSNLSQIFNNYTFLSRENELLSIIGYSRLSCKVHYYFVSLNFWYQFNMDTCTNITSIYIFVPGLHGTIFCTYLSCSNHDFSISTHHATSSPLSEPNLSIMKEINHKILSQYTTGRPPCFYLTQEHTREQML